MTCVALDKTGTLTTGRPAVVDVATLGDARPDEVLALAAALESRSEHPIGRAIVGHARKIGGPRCRLRRRSRRCPASEREAIVEGRQAVLVGNHRLFDERGL